MNIIHQQLAAVLQSIGIPDAVFSTPPNPDMGDIASGCFDVAKTMGKSPKECAEEIVEKIKRLSALGEEDQKIIERVEVAGPYVNFFINAVELVRLMDKELQDETSYGSHSIGSGKKIMVEFAHPNTHKMFHIGHLRNITTGESLVRLLENAGYEVVRVNYQGDVGLHIAKSLWGIAQLQSEYEEVKGKSLHERVAFLGKAYALGGQSYESDESVQTAVKDINRKIYARDPSLQDMYQETRSWSLEYFNHIYHRVGSHFDRLYFESEVYKRGEQIVQENLTKGIFEKSDGAIIFPGKKYGLHDRVFITSQGFAGYEAKEMALGELQFAEYHPDRIIHVVAQEQSGYFVVVLKALEYTLPMSVGREQHLIYGWVHLKEGKMSSRTGNVVLGEWLIDQVKNRVSQLMKENELSAKERDDVAETVAIAAVKYAFLKTGVTNDIAFDVEQLVSLAGDSGPYLLYIVARIKSILKKNAECRMQNAESRNDILIAPEEKQLLLKIAAYPEVTAQAAESLDPSVVAQYLFGLAQAFNAFYHACPVLQAEDEGIRAFRLRLIGSTSHVMEQGLLLLGIKTVEKM